MLRKELRRLGNWIFITLSIASAVLRIMERLSIKDFLLSILSLIVIYLLYRLRDLVKQIHFLQENPQKRLSERLLKKNIPAEMEFFAEFLAATLCHEEVFPLVRPLDKNLHLTKFMKNFTVTGYDCSTEETYEGINTSSRTIVSGIHKVTFGGSSLLEKDLGVEVFQYEGDHQTKIGRPILKLDKERLKIYLLTFVRALHPGANFKITYKDIWSGCMRFGMDAVLYAETLFYDRGIENLQSRIILDGNVIYIRAYSFDFDSFEWELDENQPLPDPSEAGAYTWRKSHPSCSRIYLVAFNRLRPNN